MSIKKTQIDLDKKLFDQEVIKTIEEQKERWAKNTVKGKDQDGQYYSDSGIPINLLYTPEDIKDIDYLKDIGFSGEAPYVRGVIQICIAAGCLPFDKLQVSELLKTRMNALSFF